MASKLNSEFNYRYQVEGNTPWAKIKHLHGFLEGRKTAARLEEAAKLSYQARLAEIEYLKANNTPEYIILDKQVELIHMEAMKETERHGFELNLQEIEILEKLLAELYEIVEPTRLKHPDGTPYTDEQMFELNEANEFTAMIGKEIYSEIVALGRPSPAKVRNAMSNPYTLKALQECGLLPEQVLYLEGSPDPLQIELKQTTFASIPSVVHQKTPLIKQEAQPEPDKLN